MSSPVSTTQNALHKNEWIFEWLDRMLIVKSPLLAEHSSRLTHLFSTRLGGESLSPYDSFNLGNHVDDEKVRSDAMKNRQTLSSSLHFDYERLILPRQMHSDNVHVMTGLDLGETLQAVDALVTNLTRIPLMLCFADCVPIILYDSKLSIVSVVHAGWRGTAKRIVKNAIDKMAKVFDSKPADILGAIGPSIGSCCYPIGTDAGEKLSQSVESADGIIVSSGSVITADLKALNAMQLYECGVKQVDVSNLCTACRPDIFYSHRKNAGTTGRQGALALLL